jgi:hypothetical protein
MSVIYTQTDLTDFAEWNYPASIAPSHMEIPQTFALLSTPPLGGGEKEAPGERRNFPRALFTLPFLPKQHLLSALISAHFDYYF